MMVLSTIRYSKSGSSDMAAKMRCHTPFWLQRLKRRNTLFQSPMPMELRQKMIAEFEKIKAGY